MTLIALFAVQLGLIFGGKLEEDGKAIYVDMASTSRLLLPTSFVAFFSTIAISFLMILFAYPVAESWRSRSASASTAMSMPTKIVAAVSK